MFAIGCSRKLKGSKQFAFIAAGETQPFVLTASETHSAAKLQLSCSIGSIAPLVRPQTHACLKFTRGFFFSHATEFQDGSWHGGPVSPDTFANFSI